MSWSGFKKNVGRATTQVMMKTGHVEKTSDRGYEVEERRYRTLESASLRLQKEAKGYLDSLRAMTASQMRIAETIDAFYGDSGASDGVSRSYKQAVEDLDAETVKALDGPYRLVDIPSKDRCPSGTSRLYHYLANEESLQPYLVDHKTDALDEDLIHQIESEYYSTKRTLDRKRVVDIMDEFRGEYELIRSVCRTTVLEPINRFCAYFPDINECIKKRNNKMLDYDSVRSKVRRLTEKPDKDASKLPRAEKEADMVSLTDFLDEHRTFPPHASLAPAVKKRVRRNARLANPDLASLRDIEADLKMELEMPSPPEARQRRENQGLQDFGRSCRLGLIGRAQNSNVLPHSAEVLSPKSHSEVTAGQSSFSRRSSGDDKDASAAVVDDAAMSSFGASTLEKPAQRQRTDSKHSSITLVPIIASSESSYSLGIAPGLDSAGSSSTDQLLLRDRSFSDLPAASRSFTSPTPLSGAVECPNGTLPMSLLLHSSTLANSHDQNPSIFFTPSELEDIMRPLKRAFLKQRADELQQAKAAYEQLNEQLSNELPQLIDLRVPYLDPSFEALVKIQLRFCAEAYSRMAQVQQYLDPQTRDQYASGELDQRVEDVLGQIRELSIAGTV